MDLRDRIRACGRESATQVTYVLAARTMELERAGNPHLASWIQSVGKTSDDGARLACALTYVLEGLFGSLAKVPTTGEFVLAMAKIEAKEEPGYASRTLGRAQDVLGGLLYRAYLGFVHGTPGTDGQVGLQDLDAGHLALAILFDAVWPEGKVGFAIPIGRALWLRNARDGAALQETANKARRPR